MVLQEFSLTVKRNSIVVILSIMPQGSETLHNKLTLIAFLFLILFIVVRKINMRFILTKF